MDPYTDYLLNVMLKGSLKIMIQVGGGYVKIANI